MTSAQHAGHRQRMRSKLERCGADVFDTYELLEMLLYNLIPVKDTKPLAKSLLSAFGSVEGILSASAEELMSTDGIGKKGARLLRAVGSVKALFSSPGRSCADNPFSSYTRCGEYLVRHYASDNSQRVIMLSLNGKMELISADVLYELDCSSAGVRPNKFINTAVMRQATVVILAHTHPYGAPLPSEADRVTNALISTSLESIGIPVIEHYVLTPSGYLGFVRHIDTAFRQRAAMDNFIREKNRLMLCQEVVSLPRSPDVFDKDNHRDAIEVLEALLEFSGEREPSELAGRMIETCGSVERIFDSELYELERISSKRAAHLLRLAVALSSRRITDGFTFGKKHTEEELIRYFVGVFFGRSCETVYAIMHDKSGRSLAAECISEGTVSASGIIPRRLITAAQKYGAASVILAHNHPSGTVKPSEDDVLTTAMLIPLVRSAGIELRAHYVIAGTEGENFLSEALECLDNRQSSIN